jgi:hypothetical protein
MLLSVLVGFSVLTADIAPAVAQPPAEPTVPSAPASHPTPEPSTAFSNDGHHHGFYAEARLGVGELWVSLNENWDTGDSAIWGRTYPLGLSAGFAVTAKLILLGDCFWVHPLGPVSDFAHVATFNLFGVGPGLKYYAPRDTFVSSSLLFSRLAWDNGNSSWHIAPYDSWSEKSRWGIAVRLSVGKEWWVSPSWWVGLGGEVMAGRMEHEVDDQAYTTKGFSLLFSSGFNTPASHASGSASALTPSTAVTGESGDSGYHTHDGFYLNVSLGPEWLWAHRKVNDSTISGRGTSLALSAGYAVVRHLVLFGEFYEAQVINPSYQSYGLSDLGLHGLGPGLRCYLVPVNLFLSGSLLLARLNSHDENPGDDTRGFNIVSDWSIMGRASIGKEWWLSANWGLGFDAGFLLGWLPEQGMIVGSRSITVKGLSLLVSASFN